MSSPCMNALREKGNSSVRVTALSFLVEVASVSVVNPAENNQSFLEHFLPTFINDLVKKVLLMLYVWLNTTYVCLTTHMGGRIFTEIMNLIKLEVDRQEFLL